MCGRYTLSTSPEDIVAEFSTHLALDASKLTDAYQWEPRFNVAPSQYCLVAATITDNPADTPELTLMRWGLIPSWAKDEKIGHKMINARAETVAEKPAFRAAFKRRRCLVFASGYYEWIKQNGGKQAIYISPESSRTIAFAGLWEQWTSADQSPVMSFTIITTSANEYLAQFHHRMPVTLAPEHTGVWLSGASSREDTTALLQPAPNDTFSALPVSNYVNSPKNEGPKCVQAL